MRNLLKKFCGLAICFIPSLALAGSGQPSDQCIDRSKQDFTVFDGTLFTGKPDLREHSIEDIEILYVSKFWPNWRGGDVDKYGLPDEQRTRALARGARKKSKAIVIDIEHWRLDLADDKALKANLRRYISVAEWVKSEVPDAQIGYFGRVPLNYYGAAAKDTSHPDYHQWSTANDKLRPLAYIVDMLLPSAYSYRSNHEEWKRYARGVIREARRLADKPVYLFLWPLYTETNKSLGYQYISDRFWRLQLETAYCYADGIVVWGGWNPVANRRAVWDENAAWWRTLMQFMSDIDAKNIE